MRLALAAELTTGTILGTVCTSGGTPVAGAVVGAVSPSGRYRTTTDAQGRFLMLGLAPDAYEVRVVAAGFEPARGIVNVLPGERERIAFVVRPHLREIARVEARDEAFAAGSTTDAFTVNGEAARAATPAESSSGLANYTQATVQGAIAAVPGVVLDPFANAIVRGGKVQDTVFDFDGIPIPQGLIAEPGGNIVGAQLPTTGVAATTLTLGGYSDVSQNALGGVVNEIPAVGTYPARASFEVADGVGVQLSDVYASAQWATPDLRWRYAAAVDAGNEYFPYGDGTSFYPAEMGTYGLALQSRAVVMGRQRALSTASVE